MSTEPIPAPIPDPSQNSSSINCNDDNYDQTCPWDNTQLKYVHVNFHYILTPNDKGNFTEYSDGVGGTVNGYQHAERLIDLANAQMSQNDPLWFQNPQGPVCQINIRTLLKGVYFHRVNIIPFQTNPLVIFEPDALYNFFDNNLINPTTEWNVFVFNSTKWSGFATGNYATVHSVQGNYLQEKIDGTPWWVNTNSQVLMHEIFHNNGLWNHPFDPDLCDDTPTRPGYDQTNNLMDYNSYWYVDGLSACQICRINDALDPDQFTLQNTVCPPLNSFFTMPPTMCSNHPLFKAPIFMEGTASQNETSHFIEIYEVPSIGSDVVQGNYKQQWYQGKIGKVELGAYHNYNFNCNKVYRVKLAVSNTCNGWNEMVKFVSTKCDCGVHNITDLELSPNPANEEMNIKFHYNGTTPLNITLINQYSGNTSASIVSNYIPTNLGLQEFVFNSSNVTPGIYFLRIMDGQELVNATCLIQH